VKDIVRTSVFKKKKLAGTGCLLLSSRHCTPRLKLISQNFPAASKGAMVRCKKGKERKSIYIALFWPRSYTQSAQAWITQFYLQNTPRLPFLRERSPDVTTTATEAADIQLLLTAHLSTPKG